MDLRQRLARLDGTSGSVPAASAAVAADVVRSLGLESTETPLGPVWHREALAVCPPPCLDAVGRVAHAFADAPPAVDGLLFLDTETTGLSGGTGTLAFLVGLAWWEPAGLRTRQLFLPSPGGERALLHDLAATLERFTTLVTYNGNSFDLPLLRTRGILARRRDLFAGQRSLDLLPVSRRLWGRRLPDCRQQTVEADLGWGGRGAADIPGALIPQAWLAFVREGRRGPLVSGLEHNRWDREGMAHILTAAAARAGAAPTDPTPPWQDAWSLARLAAVRGAIDEAAAWLDAALAAAPPPGNGGPPARLLTDAVRVLKRSGEDLRVRALLDVYRVAHGEDLWYHYEAAVLHEHRLTDLDRAVAHARALGDGHRLQRLQRKLETAPEAGAAGRS